jgi:hypothetical protein
MVTLAISGETSISVLGARAWETLLGGLLGVVAAKVILPLPGDARSDEVRKKGGSVSPPTLNQRQCVKSDRREARR